MHDFFPGKGACQKGVCQNFYFLFSRSRPSEQKLQFLIKRAGTFVSLEFIQLSILT